MAKKNLLNGAILRNKMTQEVLTCVGNGMAVKEDGSKVQLQDEVFYTVLKEGMDTDIPQGYSVVDGNLLKDGSPATQQGGLVLTEILAKVPGRVLLKAVPANKQEGSVEIFSYSPSTDEFKKLTGAVDDEIGLISTKLTDDLVLIPTIRTKDYELKDEDGNAKETITSLVGARLNVFSAKANAITAYVDTSNSEALVSGQPEFIAVHEPKDENEVLTAQIVYSTKMALDYVSEEDETIAIKNVSDPRIVRFFLSSYGAGDMYIERKGSFTLKGADFVDSITESDDRSLLLKAGDIIYYTNDKGRRKVMNAPEVKETNGYDYLLEYKSENNVLTFVLGNKNYEICTIKSEISDDRGPVVSVEI